MARNEKGTVYKCPINLVTFILLKDYKFDVTKLHYYVMYVVWLSPGGSGGFKDISWDAEICPGFRPPGATFASGE